MKYISLAYRLIFNHLLLHVILVFQIISALFISGSVISMLSLITYAADAMKPSLDSNYCYFSPMDARLLADAGIENFTQPDMNDIAKELTGVKQICYNYDISAKIESGESDGKAFLFDLTVQQDEVIAKMDVPMLFGKWLNETQPEKGTVRVVTNSFKYSVGDEIETEITDNGTDKKIMLKIVGIAANPFPHIGTSGGGGELCSANIVDTWDKKQYDSENLFGVVSKTDLERIGDFTEISPASQNCHIYFDDTLSSEELSRNFSVLEKYGFVATADSIKHLDAKAQKTTLQQKLPEMLFLLAVAVAGLGAVSAINVSNSIFMFSIFCISGCTRKQLYRIIFTYILLLSFAALIPVYIIYFIAPFSAALAPYFVLINGFSYLIPLFIVAVFAAVSFLFPFTVLKKSSLNQMRNKD